MNAKTDVWSMSDIKVSEFRNEDLGIEKYLLELNHTAGIVQLIFVKLLKK